MATAYQTAPIRSVLLALRDRLAGDGVNGASLPAAARAGGDGVFGLDTTRVVVTARDPKPPYLAERHCRLRCTGKRVVGDSGAGRRGRVTARVVAVDLYSRTTTDAAGADAAAVGDADAGHFAFEDAVADALELYTPVTDAGAALVVEPVRETDTADDPQRPAELPDYLVSTLYFEAKYTAPYSL